MNYIAQINAFENWLEYNELTAGPQLLWYKIMHVANKSGWQRELSIANTRLQSLTKCSEKSLINNRNLLIQNGLLQYKKRGRTKAGIYVLTDLTTVKNTVKEPSTVNIPVDMPVETEVVSAVDMPVETEVNTSAYVKQDETKLNEINNHDDDGYEGPAELLQRLYGKFPQGVLHGALVNWLKVWPVEMINYAIQTSFDYGKEMNALKPYMARIFQNWKSAGIDTVEKAKEANRKFRESQRPTSQSKYGKPFKTEKLPDWNQYQEEAVTAEEQARLDAEIEKRMAELGMLED